MILDGKKTSEKRLHILREKIEESGIYPRLATVLVGSDPASELYVRMKHRACEQVGIGSIGVDLPAESTTGEVLDAVRRLNEDSQISGILVQLPLPPQVDTHTIIEAVAPEKDVDGFHPLNLGRLFSGTPVFAPCTPLGVMNLLSEYDIEIAGKNAVVIGRSIEVGRPMAALLTNADATVTIAHSKTVDLASITQQADIVVAAVGRARFVTAEMIGWGATVIDIGTNYDEEKKLCGDVDFAMVEPKAAAITPVPGGVGPMTIATLMENTFTAEKMRSCGPFP
ncbi:MAG: bifunctional methylenetetrahydrofolate dehydrogenase/methenyltetrahydrofolate cyclohydrolase FolD [Methanocalculus sp. MSAO_Arc1]|uniref:bifunctional methylenetetrahydrofolate dehydrogenase/methenyltetrahydrofolate cyclohydrolase FolD n=1 Tax=Methanocalculus TaxID=71151 RepID=UPI000FF407EE|nr:MULTISPECIES: bifunctional methylenetetrahydrofolate dehydrogenase/methenyltetrahydrofolate cyclohydrolase FolD [unclassified Methanocalculus]MCP1663291.1 methylenetetrahydrofolate dehydrogenase (NADP+)/methenyltetrahydrofolate cyclohydrolase [Methanocalculus sp. AMF5]RQD79550.1 MAG: bifunctional methylenetetrahydrofolate dehydrogenase/methenyltetrahydrofolate cyclohydrolase FolD [Methanocalculus sp. MSAO_Arc1]